LYHQFAFNEIESELSGKIVKVLEDASPVEFDQPYSS
jgi:biotin carboxyl carrier protein